MKTTTIAIALIASFAAAAAAQAQDRLEVTPTIDVPYADLNLAHHAGAETMLRRIKRAAALVCGGRPDIRELTEHSHYRACVRNATDNAVAQLDMPLLTALHRGPAPAGPRFAEDGTTRR